MTIKFVLTLTVLFVSLKELQGHGMLLDPVSRSSAGKAGFPVTINWNDNGLNCGGSGVQHDLNGGNCGVCGDNYALQRPRPNENGGTYGTGVIVAKYEANQIITVKVHVSTNHLGIFLFAICPLEHSAELETEECFYKYPVKLADGSDFYTLGQGVQGDVFIDLQLPENLVCEHCVFRWYWVAGNNWGVCDNGVEALGCGEQEQFRNCADIAIESWDFVGYNQLGEDLIVPENVYSINKKK